MRTTKNIFLMVAIGLIVGSCATIKLSSGGEKVRVLAPDEVSSCKKLGQSNSSVTDKVLVKRPIETIEYELETLSRNSAAKMGGDTIVPLTVIEAGKQSFIVYKCINPDG